MSIISQFDAPLEPVIPICSEVKAIIGVDTLDPKYRGLYDYFSSVTEIQAKNNMNQVRVKKDAESAGTIEQEAFIFHYKKFLESLEQQQVVDYQYEEDKQWYKCVSFKNTNGRVCVFPVSISTRIVDYEAVFIFTHFILDISNPDTYPMMLPHGLVKSLDQFYVAGGLDDDEGLSIHEYHFDGLHNSYKLGKVVLMDLGVHTPTKPVVLDHAIADVVEEGLAVSSPSPSSSISPTPVLPAVKETWANVGFKNLQQMSYAKLAKTSPGYIEPINLAVTYERKSSGVKNESPRNPFKASHKYAPGTYNKTFMVMDDDDDDDVSPMKRARGDDEVEKETSSSSSSYSYSSSSSSSSSMLDSRSSTRNVKVESTRVMRSTFQYGMITKLDFSQLIEKDLEQLKWLDEDDFVGCECLYDCVSSNCSNAQATRFCDIASCPVMQICVNTEETCGNTPGDFLDKVYEVNESRNGIVALKSFSSGEKIGQYCGEVCLASDCSPQSSAMQLKYDKRGRFVIDSTKKGNDMRFIRGSDQPNCHFEEWKSGEYLLFFLVASKDISSQDELTVNKKKYFK